MSVPHTGHALCHAVSDTVSVIMKQLHRVLAIYQLDVYQAACNLNTSFTVHTYSEEICDTDLPYPDFASLSWPVNCTD